MGKGIYEDLDGTIMRECLVRWSFKQDSVLDGYTKAWIPLMGKNHDGTGGKHLVETRLRFNPNLEKEKCLEARGSGLTLILKGTSIQNPRTKKPWWDNECIAEARFRFNPWPEWGKSHEVFKWRNRGTRKDRMRLRFDHNLNGRIHRRARFRLNP